MARRFAYRSGTDDGNPSYADWDWSVTADPQGGCMITVTFQARPRTFWRSLVLARIRQYQLARREVPGSLLELQAAADVAAATPKR